MLVEKSLTDQLNTYRYKNAVGALCLVHVGYAPPFSRFCPHTTLLTRQTNFRRVKTENNNTVSLSHYKPNN